MEALRSAACRLGLPGRRLLVAVSGGVDSTVLLHGLHRLADPLALELQVAHVHHGLRAEAEAECAFVAQLARERGLPFRALRVDPHRLRAGRPSRSRPTLQEAARRVRYDALLELARSQGAARVVTGHTLDDQAETVLLRLLRGSGPDGLAGMPERSPDGRVVRPLLRISRQAIERFAREEHLRWVEDPSNADPAYARARLRPLLRELGAALNPRWLNAVADLAEAQRRDAEWFAERVHEEAQRRFQRESESERGRGGLRILAEGWSELPEALALRLAREALRRQGGARDVSRVHLERMLAFLRGAQPGRTLELPGGLRLEAGREAFRLVRRGDAEAEASVQPAGRC